MATDFNLKIKSDGCVAYKVPEKLVIIILSKVLHYFSNVTDFLILAAGWLNWSYNISFDLGETCASVVNATEIKKSVNSH